MTRTTEPKLKTGEHKERKKPGRVPTSCAECRRLKLRCDRKVPCETCIKRGCASICPNGSLTAGKGNRLVLANTEELHNRIEVMSARIRELEEVLRQMYSEKSDLPHPLLADSITVISHGSPESSSSSNSPEQPLLVSNKDNPDSVIDAFGTLTIGTRGETTFMSGTARSEYLIQPPLKQQSKPPFSESFPQLSKEILDAWLPGSEDVPFHDGLRTPVFSYLPPLSEAVRLSEIYLEWGKVLWYPLTRSELFDNVLGSVYRADCYEAIPGPHDLSLLFSVFALATLFDFDKPSYAVEAKEYHILSQVSMHFTSPCSETSVHTVIALVNIVQYMEMSDLEMDSSKSYVFVGLAVKLGYGIGLHLSSARWKLNDDVVQARSSAFWRLFMMDTWISFYAGRPPNVSPDWVDTPYPKDDFAIIDKGKKEMSWHMWTWQFSRLLHHVMVNAFGAKSPSYGTIVELDRKVRDFPVPPHLQPRCDGDEELTDAVIIQHVQRLLLLTNKETTLLNIHRRYFTQALQDQPNDLLKHKYGPSVMAMYRSAWRVIESHSQAVRRIPKHIERLGLFWSHALSAAIVMCMLVNRAPQSSIASSSLRELDVIYEVFQKSAPTSKPAAVLLDPITKVWKKGHDAADRPHYDDHSGLSGAELDRLGGGKTHLISQTSLPPSSVSSPSVHSSPSDAGSCRTSQPGKQYTCDGQSSSFEIHPRITQDMRVFDQFPSYTTSGFADSSESFFQAMSDVQFSGSSIYGAEVYSGHPQVLNTFLPAQLYGTSYGVPETPVVDPAWQSFVEQLGF